MTIKLVALYLKPDDIEAFMQHYEGIHMPLVAKTPHLMKTVVGKVSGSPMGESPYFLMAEMFFPDADRFREAMQSDENRAAGKDLMTFARELVTLLIVEEQ